MFPVVPFNQLVEINPKVNLVKGSEYPFVEMDMLVPGSRYVLARSTRTFIGGGAKFQSGDTLFARITPCLENGKIAQYISEQNSAFGSTEFFVFRSKPGVSDPAFVFYLASSNIIREPAEKSMSGASGRQRADLNAVKNIEVPAPPLPIQRKIAAILSAYDDLIENNQRRIKILEEMARMLYREWFVHFRFPGHEQVRMVDSELGPVPEGWEVVRFTDIVDVLSGGTPKTSIPEYWNGNIPWFTPRDRPNSYYVLTTAKQITELGLKNCNSKLFPPNTVFITARGTVGECALAAVPMAMNQTCYALRGRNWLSQYIVFLMTLELVDALKQSATGAVFDAIVVDTFRQRLVLSIPQQLTVQFAEQISPVFEMIKNLQQRNVVLKRTRDLLLPKLISGELDVSELDVVGVEEEALAMQG